MRVGGAETVMQLSLRQRNPALSPPLLGSFPPPVAMVTLALPHWHFSPVERARDIGVDRSDLRDLV